MKKDSCSLQTGAAPPKASWEMGLVKTPVLLLPHVFLHAPGEHHGPMHKAPWSCGMFLPTLLAIAGFILGSRKVRGMHLSIQQKSQLLLLLHYQAETPQPLGASKQQNLP